MKLLELVEAAATGVGRHVVDLTEGLLARGHEVHLLYSDLRCDDVFKSDLSRLIKVPRLKVSRLPMQRRPALSDLGAAVRLRRYIGQHGPFDLVHCHSTKAGLIGRGALLGHSIKRLYTPHMFFTMDPSRSGLSKRAIGMLEAGLSRISHGVIVVSREEYAHAVQLGIDPGKLCLIRNGVALNGAQPHASDRNEVRRSWGLDEDEVCIGFVGRLVPQKSPDTMLRSFAALPNPIRTKTRLVMVGGGPLEEQLLPLASQLGIGGRVVWLGERDAKTLMSGFDVFALTSDSEGHSLVILEAMARGLPVVATAVGGTSETVRPGVTGFIAPVRGVAEIAAALEILAGDAELRSRMGKASLEASRSFSVDRMVDETASLYGQVVSGAWKGDCPVDLKLATTR